jgi:hypothetical protein
MEFDGIQICLRIYKGGNTPILLANLGLIAPDKSIHEGEDFIPDTLIDNLVKERPRIVILRTYLVKIPKISTNSDHPLLSIHGN